MTRATMRRYELAERRRIVLHEVPVPNPDPLEVRVRVEACTICNRSDLVYYHYLGLRDHCAQGVFGHEVAGVIDAVGTAVTRVRPGDRVFLRAPLTGGFADYVLARELSVGLLPAGIDFAHGAMLQLLPLAVHATRGIQLGDRVLIVGQGPVGLMALQAARQRGASAITAVDLDAWRLEHASRLGARKTLRGDAGPLARAGRGAAQTAAAELGDFDVAIDAVGTPTTAQACVNAVRQNGLVVLLGTHHVDCNVQFDLVQWEKKGLRLHTAAEPTDEARVAALRVAQRIAESGQIQVEGMLTHRYALTQLQDALDQLSDSSLLLPDGESGLDAGPPAKTLKIAVLPHTD